MSGFLIHGGSIWTGDPGQPWAQAVVVRGTDIVHVGTLAEAQKHVDVDTERIDLGGGMCLPGFVEAHNHLAMMGTAKVGCDLSGIDGVEGIQQALAAWAAANPDAPVVRGHGWMPSSFPGGSPRREQLDAVTGGRPAFVFSADSHDAWSNTAALARCGVTADTPDPDPGKQYWVRDPDGSPTGHVVEGAPTLLMAGPLGIFDAESVRTSQRLTLDPAPSWGITSYMEAGVFVGPRGADAEPIYADLRARDLRGELAVRIVGTHWTRFEADDPAEQVAVLRDWHDRIRSPHLSVDILKIFVDGTFMSGGALVLEPLCGHAAGFGCGRTSLSPEHTERMIEAAHLAGFPTHIHVDADGSVRTVLDAYERVFARHGRGALRHTIAHNSMVHPDDIPRYAELGLIANCTPLWGTNYNGLYADIYRDALGADRVEERLFPYGDLVRSGAVVTYGSDIPGVTIAEIPPLIQIEALVTRRRPGFPDDEPLVPRQRIGLHDALRGYTANGAHQLMLDDRIGSLAAGKAADLVVLGEDLFRVDPHAIHAVPVVLTMMDGRVTHDAR
jgi:predicted amidohydrolase YtcJ